VNVQFHCYIAAVDHEDEAFLGGWLRDGSNGCRDYSMTVTETVRQVVFLTISPQGVELRFHSPCRSRQGQCQDMKDGTNQWSTIIRFPGIHVHVVGTPQISLTLKSSPSALRASKEVSHLSHLEGLAATFGQDTRMQDCCSLVGWLDQGSFRLPFADRSSALSTI